MKMQFKVKKNNNNNNNLSLQFSGRKIQQTTQEPSFKYWQGLLTSSEHVHEANKLTI